MNLSKNRVTQPTFRAVAVGLCFALMIGWLALLSFYAIQYAGYDYPDEAANAFFAGRYAQTGQFHYPTGLTAAQLDIYRPRSVAVAGTDYVPGSFLGFITLQGLLLRGGTFAPFVFTGLIFIGALASWYRLVRRYWERSWALLSVGILITIPAVAVYQTLPWLHASLFTSFLIITGLALVRFQERQTWWRAIVIGLAYGAALFIRPIEVVWTGPAIAAVMIVHRKGWHYLIGTAVVTMIIQAPWILVGLQTFGTVLASGYSSQGISLAVVPDAAISGKLAWYRILVPPGGWSWHFIPAAWESLVMLLPALSAMTAVALLAYFRRKFVQPIKIIKIGAICLIGLYYLIFYGSYDLNINGPVLAGVISSYVRYWLPLFVAMAAGATTFVRLVTRRRLRLAWPLAAVVIGVNIWTTLGHFNGGLLALHRQDVRFQAIVQQIKAQTESNSLIITGRYDKVLLGYRLVSFYQPTTPSDWSLVAGVAAARPVYVIGSIVTARLETWQSTAAAHGLVATAVAPIDGDTLWRLRPLAVQP